MNLRYTSIALKLVMNTCHTLSNTMVFIILSLLMITAGPKSVVADTNSPYVNGVKALQPLSYIRFNNNLTDYSATGIYSGEWIGGSGYSPLGQGSPMIGDSTNLSGLFNNTHVQLANSETLDFTQAATLMAWVKFDNTPVGTPSWIIGKSGYATDLDLLADTDNRIHFLVDAHIDSISQTVINTDTWYFITATYKRAVSGHNGVMELYVNGQRESYLESADITRNENSSPIVIGNTPYWFDYYGGSRSYSFLGKSMR